MISNFSIDINQKIKNYNISINYSIQTIFSTCDIKIKVSLICRLVSEFTFCTKLSLSQSSFYLRKRYFTRALHDIANIANVREKCSAKFDATLIAKEREKKKKNNKKPGISSARHLRNFSKFRLHFLL